MIRRGILLFCHSNTLALSFLVPFRSLGFELGHKTFPFPLASLFSRTTSRGTPRFVSSGDWRMSGSGSNLTSSHLQGGDEQSTVDRVEDWTVCLVCRGEGRFLRPPSRKSRQRYKRTKFAAKGDEGKCTREGSPSPPEPKPRIEVCKVCQGSGVVKVRPGSSGPTAKLHFPRVAIVGGGLAGLALASACRHRGIPHRVYERDTHFSQRTQGYGLTMQQASKALKGFGIVSLQDGITSTKHVVHKHDGTVVGQWGLRHWGRLSSKDSLEDGNDKEKKQSKRQNVHIPRQSLRYQLLLQAMGNNNETGSDICWNYRLIDYEEQKSEISLSFQVGGKVVTETADILVGADGIRSKVREQFIGEEVSPLRYLGCIVILGICPLDTTARQLSNLLDGETVFQTADGTTRMYMMPYSDSEYMWQLSYPIDESDAASISRKGPDALKRQAMERCQSWHTPIPELLKRTPTSMVSGYPVYDRPLMTRSALKQSSRVTLIGDACHPMSPFKGQGANQALLDALALARALYSTTTSNEQAGSVVLGSEWELVGTAIEKFEAEMLDRSAIKVQASARAAQFLHSDVAIQEGDVTRGAAAVSTPFVETDSSSVPMKL